ncbi:hypothetical protein QQS21_005210 [Conoideocrella luteorostrata]|uniref:Peptidase M60 domain-containing protein n=1 Tax=Conoideocrella luteorostrata TaxID=1105319 RepID=A0AAJ0FZ75_9HYPO|nr:hypothetical protein QQS21_005210 [Conoideocrella luteorostrata]
MRLAIVSFVLPFVAAWPASVTAREEDWSVQTSEHVYSQTELSQFPQSRVITVFPYIQAKKERIRLNQWFKWADFQPTGFYLNPESYLQVSVSGLRDAGPRVELLVGTPGLVDPENLNKNMESGLQRRPIQNGNNFIKTNKGGIIYVRYSLMHDQDIAPPVNITLGGGDAAQPFPFFQQGKTTNAQWRDMLRVTKVPFAELAGERVIVTGLAATAGVYAERGQDQNGLLDTYADIVTAQDLISGIHADASDWRDKPSPLRPMIVQSNKNDNPNAWHYRAAITAELYDDIWWQPKLRRSWIVWHELGHHRQHVDTFSWNAVQEVTVNIYALAASRTFPTVPGEVPEHGTVEEWDNARKYLGQTEAAKLFDDADHFTMLAMFEQLRVVFGGDSFYHRLHVRSRAASKLVTNADKKHFFMTQAAEIATVDLTSYFTKWGLKPDERTVNEMSKQPKPAEDYTTRPIWGGAPAVAAKDVAIFSEW